MAVCEIAANNENHDQPRRNELGHLLPEHENSLTERDSGIEGCGTLSDEDDSKEQLLTESAMVAQGRRMDNQEGSHGKERCLQEVHEDDLVLKRPVTQRHVIDISQEISSSWKHFGIELGMKSTTLENIDVEHQKVENRASAMLFKWRQENGCQATLDKLVFALMKVGRKDLSDSLLDGSDRKMFHLIEIHSSTNSPNNGIYCCKDIHDGEVYTVERKQWTKVDKEFNHEKKPVQEQGFNRKLPTLPERVEQLRLNLVETASLQGPNTASYERFTSELQETDTGLLRGETEQLSAEETSDVICGLYQCCLSLQVQLRHLNGSYHRLETAQSQQSEEMKKMSKIEGILANVLGKKVDNDGRANIHDGSDCLSPLDTRL